MMIKNKRAISLLLCFGFAFNNAHAAMATPQTDEAVYVNLDAYGVQKELRVVKGVSRNGADKISDFGNYSEVNNLTSNDKPNIREDGVDFDLKNVESERFYYECIPNETNIIRMPWDFDISYKLNGKPVNKEELAGVEGLVEITIHAIPNQLADEYYKNNMTLVLGTGVNMDCASNIEAEGAQIQSFGNYKFAMFFALPSEENTYVIRIGAEKFEFTGIYFLMTPITLSQLDIVESFKQAKDKIGGSRDDLYNGINSVLNTMNSMKSGLSVMQSGIEGIQDVRKQLIESRTTIDPSIDAALAQLEILSGDTNALIPTLETTRTDINTATQNITDILNTLVSTQTDIGEYQTLLTNSRENLTQIQNLLKDVQNITDKDKFSLKYITNDLSDLSSNSSELSNSLKSLGTSISDLNEIERILNNIAGSGFIPADLALSIQKLVDSISIVKTNTSIVLNDLSNTCENLSHLLDNSKSFASQLTEIKDVIDAYDGTAENSIENLKRATELVQSSLMYIDAMLMQIDTLNQTIQTINLNTNEAITQISTTTNTLAQTIEASKTALSNINETIRSLREKSDSATEQSLNGLLDIIGKATNSNDTNEIREATSSIHNTITDEVNEIENDSNLLNIDSSLAVRSCTSPQNPSPSSLQFIARTDEIVIDEMKEVQEKIANEKDEGVFVRIKNIFVKIFDAIKNAL